MANTMTLQEVLAVFEKLRAHVQLSGGGNRWSNRSFSLHAVIGDETIVGSIGDFGYDTELGASGVPSEAVTVQLWVGGTLVFQDHSTSFGSIQRTIQRLEQPLREAWLNKQRESRAEDAQKAAAATARLRRLA